MDTHKVATEVAFAHNNSLTSINHAYITHISQGFVSIRVVIVVKWGIRIFVFSRIKRPAVINGHKHADYRKRKHYRDVELIPDVR
jgi:hypothetical protein